MSFARSLLLAASQSPFLRERAPRYRFVRRTVARFMPGEELGDALDAAQVLEQRGLATVFTHLGENLAVMAEAEQVTEHYLQVLDAVVGRRLPTEISVKLTQLGLDLAPERCFRNLMRLLEQAGPEQTVWIDMEASNYVDVTLDLFRRALHALPRATRPRAGICLQAYLYRTAADLESLLPLGPAVRLVKGAYREPATVALPRKRDVDVNFFRLTSRLFSPLARKYGVHAAIATHDRTLIARIEALAREQSLPRTAFEFQMLFGIQRQEQLRLAQAGWRSTVLIAYGSFWYPWFMRRLAERPANVGFIVRNLLG